jgi:hypothetical protein
MEGCGKKKETKEKVRGNNVEIHQEEGDEERG